MLIDSNIVIYSMLPEHAFLNAWLVRPDISFSVITRIEVLGFVGMADAHRERFERLFAAAPTLALDDAVRDTCIRLRRSRRMKLGDVIIAATALTHRLHLVTRNVGDFKGISDLGIVNPFATTERAPKTPIP